MRDNKSCEISNVKTVTWGEAQWRSG